MLDGLYHATILADNLPTVNLSPDPDDNKIIATAIAGHADYLVSGDKGDLLILNTAENIPIVTARHMVEILNIVD